MFERELNLRLGRLSPIKVVFLDGLLQGGKPLPRVVEAGDGLVEPTVGQIDSMLWNSPKARPACRAWSGDCTASKV